MRDPSWIDGDETARFGDPDRPDNYIDPDDRKVVAWVADEIPFKVDNIKESFRLDFGGTAGRDTERDLDTIEQLLNTATNLLSEAAEIAAALNEESVSEYEAGEWV